MTQTTLFSIIGALFIAPLAVWRFLKWCYSLDEVVDKSLVRRARKVFAENADTTSVLRIFLTYFDKLFRPSSTFRPQFWRSAAVSCTVLAIVASLYVIISTLLFPDHLDSTISGIFYAGDDWLFPQTSGEAIGQILTLLVTANVIGDFISIWETRLVLQKLHTVKSSVGQLAWWLLDLLLSLGIFVVSVFFGLALYAIPNWENIDALEVLAILSYMPILAPVLIFEAITFSGRGTGTALSICLYTTLTTTLWASLSIVITKTWLWFRFTGGLIRAKSHPFGTLTACVLASLIAVATILSCIVWLYQGS